MRAQTALLYCAHRYLILTCLLASLCSIPMGCLDVSICIYITMNKHSMTHNWWNVGKLEKLHMVYMKHYNILHNYISSARGARCSRAESTTAECGEPST